MKKITLDFNRQKNITKKFKDVSIKIRPYIEADEMVAYIQMAIEKQIQNKIENINKDENENFEYFFSPTDVLMAYGILDLCIIDSCTNIEIEDVNYDVLQSSGFIKFISDNIVNYEINKRMLDIEINKHNNQCCFVDFTNENESIIDSQSSLDSLVQQLQSVDPKVLDTMLKNSITDSVKITAKKELKDVVKGNLKDHKKSLS